MEENGNGKHLGTVLWFQELKGFGKILSDNGQEYFVHFSGIQPKEFGEFRTLIKGERVSFDVEPNERGPCAVDVTPL